MAETFDFITVTTPDGSVQYKAPPMAAEFSASASYAAGDYCTYQGALYRFSAAHAAGAWTGTDATVVSLAGDVSDLRSAIDLGSITPEVKTALLACFENVAWIGTDGQDYVDALYDALYNRYWEVTNNLTNCTTSNESVQTIKGAAYTATITASTGYVMTGATVSITMGGTDITSTAYSNGVISIPAVTGALVITISAAAKTVSSISAVYTQSGTVYDTDSLDSLKSDLVVTATYDDSSTEVVTTYTLSGTLTEGTSTITVSYGGKTTTFTVSVTAYPYSAYWDFTKSLTDEVSGDTVQISNVANGTVTQTVNGLSFVATGQYSAQVLSENDISWFGKTLTIEFGAMTTNFSSNDGTKGSQYNLPNGGIMAYPIPLVWRGVSDMFSGWYSSISGWADSWYTGGAVSPTYFSNKTVVINVSNDGGASVSCDGQTIATIPSGNISDSQKLKLGYNAKQVYANMVIKTISVSR